jgi:HlyD family secretion protein
MGMQAENTDINKVLGLTSRNHRWRRRAIWLVFLLVAGIGGWTVWSKMRPATVEVTVQYRTEAARLGDLTVNVRATGQLKPTNTVGVGSEVSGTIDSVEVDYNSPVKVGQVLAKINLEKLEATRLQAKASLDAAQAEVQDAQVTLAEKQSEYERILEARRRSKGQLPSQSDVDTAKANFERAKVAVAGKQAAVVKAEATLAQNDTDIKKAIIKSPVNGVVLARNVEPGQTIQATFSVTTMFELAEDLSRMKLEVNIDEADVGHVKENQPVSFTVDAYPGRQFPGKIVQVRYASTTTNNVVTYTAIISVDNKDLSLRPGMTATAVIAVQSVKNALLAPNIALRFRPTAAGSGQQEDDRGLLAKIMPGPPPMSSSKAGQEEETEGGARLWVLRNQQPFPLEVKTGITNGKLTEIFSDAIQAGTPLIVDVLKVGK